MKKSNKIIDPTINEDKKAGSELVHLYENQERLNALLEITKNLSSELDIESLLSIIMEEVKHILDADRCTVFLFDEEKNELWSRVAIGIDQEIRFPADRGIAGHVFKTGEIINIPEAYKDPRFNPEVDKQTGYKTTSILAMPMYSRQKKIIGVFHVLNKKEGIFSSKNEEILSAISMIAGSAIENSLLYEDQKKAFVSLIETLSTTLDKRDYITAGHSRRVTLYSLEIGRLMKLDSEQMEVLRYAALLHDIGKIGVPEIVLFKDRKLTEEEFRIIKNHANTTKSILSKIHFQRKHKEIPVIAGSHHEKLDGTGYPEKLMGDEIPLGGKIIALADVFDALTSRRQYRDRVDLEEVVQTIDQETGAAFEPYVVYNFKFIALDRLIRILEYGHANEFHEEDLLKLRNYTLKDIVEIRSKSKKTDTELEVENNFMRYYLRQYRTK